MEPGLENEAFSLPHRAQTLEQSVRGFEARLTVAHEELLVERKAVKHLRAECQSLAEKEARAGKEVHYLESLMQQYEGQLVRLEAREAGLMAALRSLVVGVTIWSYVHHRRNCLLLLRQGTGPPKGVRGALGFLGGSTEVGAPEASEAMPAAEMMIAAEKAPRRPDPFADSISDEETCVKIGHLDSDNALGDAEDYVDEEMEEEEEERIEEVRAKEAEAKEEEEEKIEEVRAKEVEAKEEEEEKIEEVRAQDVEAKEEEEEEKMRVLLERLVAEEKQVGRLERRLAAMEEAAAVVGRERAEMGAREQRALARIEELEERAAAVGRERAELGIREQRALARIEELEESLANVRSELELVSINLGKSQVRWAHTNRHRREARDRTGKRYKGQT
jgi:chromosome segregation ATPase